MDAQDRLRHVINQRQGALRAAVPSDRHAAILTLTRARDRLTRPPAVGPIPDLLTGIRVDDLGGNRALQFCLEATTDTGTGDRTPANGLDGWAERFLDDCGRLVEAELVLGHCETGFMRIVADGDEKLDAWVATRRIPPGWRERTDIGWWAGSLATRHAPALRELASAVSHHAPGEPAHDSLYQRLAETHLATMAYQFGYPPDTVLDGCPVQVYRDVLTALIARALRIRGRGETSTHQSESALVDSLTEALAVDPAVIATALSAFTVDRETAAYHAAVPGVAAAPLVRVGPDQIIASIHGLTTQPLFFLAHEIRRRAAPAYHNAAYLREDVFRQDLYALFPDRRFVTSERRIELRRAGGDVRTDIDAVVFDRKTGTLGVFELKSHDPFARSAAEIARQRDSVLYANRQVAGVLDWLKRHGADDLLNRVDRRTARTFRVHRVVPFVLGRYLVHFGDGPEPDRRAAWATWPEVLRLLGDQPVRATDANPILSLSSRLVKQASLAPTAVGNAPREIVIGDARLVVHSSWAAFQAATFDRGEPRV